MNATTAPTRRTPAQAIAEFESDYAQTLNLSMLNRPTAREVMPAIKAYVELRRNFDPKVRV